MSAAEHIPKTGIIRFKSINGLFYSVASRVRHLLTEGSGAFTVLAVCKIPYLAWYPAWGSRDEANRARNKGESQTDDGKLHDEGFTMGGQWRVVGWW